MTEKVDNSESFSKAKECTTEDEQSNKIVENEEILKEYNPQRTSLKISVLAIFVALGPVLSISFIWFPYFEFMTLTNFIGGIILGPLYGIIQAILSTTLFEIIVSSFLGVGLPIFPFKVIGFILVGISGGIIGKILPANSSLSWRLFIATIGGMLTLCYDLLVNIGMIIFLDFQFISYFVVFATGLPVTAIRVASNTFLFAFVPEIVNRAIKPALENISFRRNRSTKS